MAWKNKTKPKLPMYKSRFRQNGVRFSVAEICNRSAAELFPSNDPYIALMPASSPFCNTKFESFLRTELFTTACDLYQLSYMLDLNARHPKLLGSVQRQFFEDTYVAMFYSLVLFSAGDSEVVKTVDYYRQQAWIAAAFIYLNTGIREWDASFHSMKCMILEFISTLKASDFESMWSSSPEVLVWMLFVGICGACDGAERKWLLHEFRRGIRILRVGSFEQLEEFLKSMLFVESMKRRFLNRIWQELNT